MLNPPALRRRAILSAVLSLLLASTLPFPLSPSSVRAALLDPPSGIGKAALSPSFVLLPALFLTTPALRTLLSLEVAVATLAPTDALPPPPSPLPSPLASAAALLALAAESALTAPLLPAAVLPVPFFVAPVFADAAAAPAAGAAHPAVVGGAVPGAPRFRPSRSLAFCLMLKRAPHATQN